MCSSCGLANLEKYNNVFSHCYIHGFMAGISIVILWCVYMFNMYVFWPFVSAIRYNRNEKKKETNNSNGKNVLTTNNNKK